MKKPISDHRSQILLLLLLPAFLLAACHQKPKPITEKKTLVSPKLLISCEGIGEVKLSDSYDDLEKKFGASALSWHENSVRGRFVTIWENRPEQVNIYWQEKEAPFRKIKYIETGNDGSPYQTEDGLMLGISLRDVVRINGGMPLTFHNFFASDANGAIISFNNGDIPRHNPCLSGSLEITAQRNINIGELKKLQKLKMLESYGHYMEHIDAILADIRIYSVNPGIAE